MYFNKFELHYLHSVTWLSHGCIALVIIGAYFEQVCPRKLKFGQDEGTKRKIFQKATWLITSLAMGKTDLELLT